MFDKDTLIVSYDSMRGEGSAGRAKLGKGLKTAKEREAAGAGDCIDCGYCVQVCPTGIDIRNGLQIQCISCALCIDACDTIMDSLGWERGLVAYTSERQVEEGRRARLLRPKVIGYFLVLLVIVAALAWNVLHQQLFDVSVAQERQPLYVTLSDGRIQNSYEFKMNNKTGGPLELEFEVVGLEAAELDLGKFSHIELAPDQRLRLRAHIKHEPPEGNSGSQKFRIRAVPVNRTDLQPFEKEAVFSWPVRN
jgi:cytochrome c oxidase accessory protein FixG